MVRHLIRLVWNRRRHNWLVLLELGLAFLVAAGALTVVSVYVSNWVRPLGFDPDDVWYLQMGYGPFHQYDDERKVEVMSTMRRIESHLRGLPDVVGTSVGSNVPFTGSHWGTSVHPEGERVQVRWTIAHPNLLQTLDLQLLGGRFFEEADIIEPEEDQDEPCVVTANLARRLWGNEDPIGKYVPKNAPDENGEVTPSTLRVVGVIQDMRIDGDHRGADYTLMEPFHYGPTGPPPHRMLVRVQPGATAELEQRLIEEAQTIAGDWSFSIRRLEDRRADMRREALLPLLFGGILVTFLLLMVALGLIGVVWQNVVRRTDEIGLRRALGATARGAMGQILGELVVLTSFAVILGTIVYVQLPLLGVFTAATGAVVVAVGAAVALTFGVVLLCGAYPSWLASRIEPAQALMYE